MAAAPFNPYVFKVEFGEEIRRLTFAAVPSYELLKDNIDKLYGLSRPFLLKYVDPEGDLITFTSTAEIEEAVQLSTPKDGHLLVKVKVVPTTTSNPQPSQQKASAQPPPSFFNGAPSAPSGESSDDENWSGDDGFCGGDLNAIPFQQLIQSFLTPENIDRFKSFLTPENIDMARRHFEEHMQRTQQPPPTSQQQQQQQPSGFNFAGTPQQPSSGFSGNPQQPSSGFNFSQPQMPFNLQEMARNFFNFAPQAPGNTAPQGFDQSEAEKRKVQEEEDGAMKTLNEMGFLQEDLNRSIYRANGRNLQRTLNILISTPL